MIYAQNELKSEYNVYILCKQYNCYIYKMSKNQVIKKSKVQENMKELQEIVSNYKNLKIAQIVFDKVSNSYILRTKSKVWFNTAIQEELKGNGFVIEGILINDSGFLNIIVEKREVA